MGVERQTMSQVAAGGLRFPVETASTGSAMSVHGVSIIASTKAVAYQLPNPVPGIVKFISANIGSTANVTTVQTPSTSVTFHDGSTSIALSTSGSALMLVGLSTTQWGVVVGSNY